ncbi:uncharacterized protein G2W53_033857 [Senna tora]|uniref:BED-type domain-containing protein n=1 Tax=Senna tora TaxID=362788 RepID=A0A834T238_9FABA|nr:uncharacterized protein G2W53_033857 [Senna tora]
MGLRRDGDAVATTRDLLPVSATVNPSRKVDEGLFGFDLEIGSHGRGKVERMDPSSSSNANASTPSSGQQSITDSSTLSQRGKTDPAWDHFSFKKEGRTNVYTCLHCLSVYKGGGINRMKQHLACVTGQIMSCKKVSHDVRHQMLESLKNVQQKKAN